MGKIYTEEKENTAAKKPEREQTGKRQPIILFAALLAIIIAVIFLLPRRTQQSDQNGNDKKKDTSDPYYYTYNSEEYSTLTVFIDAGHGYDDPGTFTDNLCGLYEKDINLALALKLRDKLSAMGINVIMSREDDEKPEGYENTKYVLSPADRAELVNSSDTYINLMISLHCNSFPSYETVSGTRLYFYAGSDKYTCALARATADGINSVINSNLPRLYSMEYEDSYYILKNTSLPAILVECGFVTNKGDAELMLDEKWREDFTTGLANGIFKFFNMPFTKTVGSSISGSSVSDSFVSGNSTSDSLVSGSSASGDTGPDSISRSEVHAKPHTKILLF